MRSSSRRSRRRVKGRCPLEEHFKAPLHKVVDAEKTSDKVETSLSRAKLAGGLAFEASRPLLEKIDEGSLAILWSRF